MKKVLLVLVLLSFMMSCLTTVKVDSNVKGADVILDGKKVGTTPYKGKVSAYAWYDPEVVLVKEGYKTRRTRFNIQSRVGHIIAGLLFFYVPIIGWPLLFTCNGPTKRQFIEMEKE